MCNTLRLDGYICTVVLCDTQLSFNLQSIKKPKLTFMGPRIVKMFQYISNKMQLYTVYLYLETALHVSGGTSTYHQEHIQLYLQHLVLVTTLLPSAAVVEEFQLFHDSGRWQ